MNKTLALLLLLPTIALAQSGFYRNPFTTNAVPGFTVLTNALGYVPATNTLAGIQAATGNRLFIGTDSTFVGYQSGLTNSAFDNSGFGAFSLQSVATSPGNTAQGLSALRNLISGLGGNTAQGSKALYSLTNGYANSAQGFLGLYELVNGIYNTADGYAAGRYLADGGTPLTSATNSLYIGANTKASADNVTNETVIGYNATGRGNNTVQIGDTNVTDTYIQGTIHSSGTNSSFTGIVEPTTPIMPATKGYVDSLNQFGFQYYFHGSSNNPVAPTNYYVMQRSTFPVGANNWTNTFAGVTNNQYVINYISVPPPGLTLFKAGSYAVTFTAYRSTGGGDAVALAPEIYRTFNGTNEIEIGTGISQTLTGTRTQYTIQVTVATNVVLDTTNNVIVKLKASSVGGTPTVFSVSEGTTTSGLLLPITSATFVEKAGDTMTGFLTVQGTATFDGRLTATNGSSASLRPLFVGTDAAANYIEFQNPVAASRPTNNVLVGFDSAGVFTLVRTNGDYATSKLGPTYIGNGAASLRGYVSGGSADGILMWKSAAGTSLLRYVFGSETTTNGMVLHTPGTTPLISVKNGDNTANADFAAGNATIYGNADVRGTATVTNIIQQQVALTTSGSVTNFVADLATAGYQLVTVAANVNFTHATNSAAGRGTTILLANFSGSDTLLAVPSTWRQRGVETTLTNGTVTALALYSYGSDNTTNIIASGSWFK